MRSYSAQAEHQVFGRVVAAPIRRDVGRDRFVMSFKRGLEIAIPRLRSGTMKIQVPDEVKGGVPTNTWGKILSTTPVVMAVVATLLAGLASSEMTRAQYDRFLAAQ